VSVGATVAALRTRVAELEAQVEQCQQRTFFMPK
jgi:hypothetical protein